MILADTQALVWLDAADRRLGAAAAAIARAAWAAGGLAVSAISFWEVAMLVRKGRLDVGQPASAWRRQVLETGITEIALDGAIGAVAEELVGMRGDPADRIILATALALEATLLTADAKLLAWPGPVDRLDASR